MKKLILTGASCLMTSGLIQAANINITDFEQTDTTASGFAITVVADGNDWLFGFSRTADLDGLGTDDTLSFDLRSSAFEGSSYSATTGDLTLGTAFDYSIGGTVSAPTDQHFGEGGDLDTNESLQLSIENIVYTQGEGLGWTATFDGFNEMAIFANPGGTETYYLGTNAADVVLPASSTYTLATPVDILTLTSTDGAGKRVRDLDFSFTTAEAVPEPSSTALLGLASLGLILRRKRS